MKEQYTSLFSSTADIRFKYKPIVTSVNEVPVDWMQKRKHLQNQYIVRYTVVLG